MPIAGAWKEYVSMNDQTVEAVLFDYGGVIAEEGFVEGLTAIADKNGLDRKYFLDRAFDLIYTTGYLTGRAGEAAFWKAMRDATGITGADRELTEEILTRFVLRPWVLDLVRDLRSMKATVGILSDQTNWLDELNKRDDFFRHFDRVFNSYHLGLSKRDGVVFDEIVRRLGSAPERTCFIDDSEGNCRRARERGLRVILYHTGGEMLDELARYFPGLDPSKYAVGGS